MIPEKIPSQGGFIVTGIDCTTWEGKFLDTNIRRYFAAIPILLSSNTKLGLCNTSKGSHNKAL